MRISGAASTLATPRPPGRFAAEESAAAPSVAHEYRWKVDAAPVVAAEGMMLEWMAEPRVGLLLDLQHIRRQLADLLGMHDIAAVRAATAVGDRGTRAAGSPRLWWCCWLCSDCWTRYRCAVSIAAFTMLVAKFPRFVTLWRAHMRSANSIFSPAGVSVRRGAAGWGRLLGVAAAAGAGSEGQAAAGDRLCCPPVAAAAGGEGHAWGVGRGRGKSGEGGGKGGGVEGGVEGGGVGGVCAARGGDCCPGRAGRRAVPLLLLVVCSSSGMVVSGVDPTEFALKCGTLFCQPMFARAAALIFSDCAAHRHKESVEDAAVEGAVNRLAAAERSTEGSGVQDRGKRAVDPEGPAVSPAASAAGSAGARTKGSNTASGARLVPVNSNAVVALFTYRVTCLLQWVRFYGPRVNPAEDCRCFNQLGYATALPHPLHDLPNLLQRFGAVPKLPAATGQEGLARTGWEEFPEGDRAAVAEEENDPARKFFGCSTFHVGAFRGGGSELDEEEMQMEYNVREFYPPPAHVDSFTIRSHHLPGGEITVQINTSGPIFPTLGHCVEEFLRRAPRESGRPLPAVVPDSLVAALLEGVMEEHRLMLLYMNTLLLTKENALPAILEPVSTNAGGQVEGEKQQQQQQQQQQGEEEWRMWEEVDSWRMAAGNAWPAVEAHDSPLQMGAGKGRGRVQGEVSEECCEGMMRAIKDAGKGQKGRTGAWYLVPWLGGCGKVEGAGVQLKLCSRCGKAAYCSRECQKAHWPTHKLTCLPKAKGKEKAEE
ncbi:unnamed protein product [Closterium sp. NIES-64]|nr:unnamed protein product [Closterium sp. NIES-64]